MGSEDKIVEIEKQAFKKVREFIKTEASGGIVLMIAAVVALIVANSPLFSYYSYFLDNIEFRFGFTDLDHSFHMGLEKSLRHWINDGLMVVFFFLVGLEIKKEFMEGELSSASKVMLPAVAAIGGIVAPALIFYYINIDHPENVRGWAIPTATDIAFALGIASLLGSRVPTSLKVLLTAIAIMDDIAAILIIAIFYTEQLSLQPLYISAAALILLFALNRKNVCNTAPYVLVIIVLWVTVLQSGVHATIAGVLGAMFLPMRNKRKPISSPVIRIEHYLQPWVAFFVLPLFAFANAGVPLFGLTAEELFTPLSLGIIFGLVLGKPLGIFSIIWLTVVTGMCSKPTGSTWAHLFAISLMCGIGFTMSLFIGGLAFVEADKMVSVRFGVILASVVAAVASYMILRHGPTTGLPREEVIGDIDDQTVPSEKS